MGTVLYLAILSFIYSSYLSTGDFCTDTWPYFSLSYFSKVSNGEYVLYLALALL